MDGKQSAAMLAPPNTPPTSPIAQLQVRIKELETGLRAWLVKQPTAVEAAIVTATSAAQGAFIGALMGSLTSDAAILTPPPNAPGLNSQAMASLKQAQAFAGGPLVQARNFAVMTGTNAGISCVMRRIRGVEDMQSSMVAAFGSGAMFSLVSGMGGPNQAVNAVTSGLFFALIQGGLFKNFRTMRRTSRKAYSMMLLFPFSQIVLFEMSIFLLGLGFSFLITYKGTVIWSNDEDYQQILIDFKVDELCAFVILSIVFILEMI